MKAAVVTRYGPPEVVRIAQVATPSIDKDDLVLVRVHATTVNRTDCGLAMGIREAFGRLLRRRARTPLDKARAASKTLRRNGYDKRRQHPPRPDESAGNLPIYG